MTPGCHRIARLVVAAAALALLGQSDAASKPGLLDSAASLGVFESGVVYCANLVYAEKKTSVCYADHFLKQIEKETHVRTSKRFTPVKLESEKLYGYPFAMMTGQGKFKLTPTQRQSLRNYLSRGGFLVASAGCSSEQWAISFEQQIKQVFPKLKMIEIGESHPIFRTVYDIKALGTKRAGPKPKLKGLEIEGKLALVYSKDGLNDTAKAGDNCCCCGGNEVKNARQINVNLMAYALTH